MHLSRLAAVLSLIALPAACAAAPAGGEDVEGAEQRFSSEPCGELSAVAGMKVERMELSGAQIRVGVKEAAGAVTADVMYLHGFADRFDNHLALFDELSAAGLRVVTFDYPSHGESCGASINRFDLEDLAVMAGKIDAAKRTPGKPLYLAGWSTGGLLAVRIAQGFEPTELRPVGKMALFAPGVMVRPVMTVDPGTLSSNLDGHHVAPPKPGSTLEAALFTAAIAGNSTLSHRSLGGVPALVVTGDAEKDRYVNTAGVERWVKARRDGGDTVLGLSCPAFPTDEDLGGRHELDNEPAPQGDAVRGAAVAFLADGAAPTSGGHCAAY